MTSPSQIFLRSSTACAVLPSYSLVLFSGEKWLDGTSFSVEESLSVSVRSSSYRSPLASPSPSPTSTRESSITSFFSIPFVPSSTEAYHSAELRLSLENWKSQAKAKRLRESLYYSFEDEEIEHKGRVFLLPSYSIVDEGSIGGFDYINRRRSDSKGNKAWIERFWDILK